MSWILSESSTFGRAWDFDGRRAARFQDAVQLVHRMDAIWKMFEHIMRPHFINAGIEPRPWLCQISDLIDRRAWRAINADKPGEGTVGTA